jgi:radical SAM/Cys-rich protein
METTTPPQDATPNPLSQSTFCQAIAPFLNEPLTCRTLDTLQINLGRRCNHSCRHCHHQAGPDRHETMTKTTMDAILAFLPKTPVKNVDITGGAPELHPHLKDFITAIAHHGYPVNVRTNLTALSLPSSTGLPEFFKDHGVTIIASLPCYLQENTDKQRGHGVHQQSIQMLETLNNLGFGIDPRLTLNLVHNPGGPFLPASQHDLEAIYRKELRERHGIHFNDLLTITNAPLGNFLNDLHHTNTADAYQDLCRTNFNPDTIPGLMCQHQLTVGWDGHLYDCDFNLAANLPIHTHKTIHTATLHDLLPRPVVTGDHCFACTAGHGSSCQGALVTQ